MLQVDVPLSFAVGSTLALAARHHLKNEPSLTNNRYLGATAAYLGLFLVPSCLYFLERWTDWDVMYAWSRQTLPPWVAPGFAMALFAMGLLGFVSAHASIQKGWTMIPLALIALCLAFTGAVCALYSNRFLFVGTQAQFLAEPPPVNIHRTDLPLGFAILTGGVMGVPMAVLLWRFSRKPGADAR